MLRFSFALAAASVVTLAGFGTLGMAAAPAGPQLKVIATVVAHPRPDARPALGMPILQ